LKLKVDKAEHHNDLAEWGAKIETLLGDHIVTSDQRSIAKVVVELLNDQGKTVTFAESCTGGKIASLITQVSGASNVFESGIVSYSNDIKHQVLNVSKDSLEQHGAVSEAVVREMLTGALDLSGADLGVSVSGIAGPNGGTPEKPVGTVWLAWGSKDNIKARQFLFPGTRVFFQEVVSALALDLVRRELISSEEEPVYFRSRRTGGKA
jgi:nicotinamide-nucleotide amidase